MAVIFVHQGPTFTRERYEEAVRRLLPGGKSRLDSPTDWPVEGLLVHIAGQSEDGLYRRRVGVGGRVPRFGQQLMPVLQEIGITDQPELYPVHTFVKA